MADDDKKKEKLTVIKKYLFSEFPRHDITINEEADTGGYIFSLFTKNRILLPHLKVGMNYLDDNSVNTILHDLHEKKVANVLRQASKKHKSACWLTNTGISC